jgi:hypothetical protein
VLWATTLASAAGLLLGLMRFHVFSVVVASVLLAVMYVIALPSLQVALLTGLVCAFILLGALQGGYLVGLMIPDHAWSRIFARFAQPHLFAGEEWPRDPSRKQRQFSAASSRVATTDRARDPQQIAQDR